MGALRAAIVALTLFAATPAHADTVDRWRPYVDEASARFGIPTAWIARVMRAESAGMTMLDGRPITSRAGAMGLMQLMPATWGEMRAVLRLGADPYDPHDNIIAGSFYLRLMYDRFGYPGMFAAYNAGPGRYAEHLVIGRALPGETRAYLATVGGGIAERRMAANGGPANPLFFSLRATAATPVGTKGTAANGLFVSLGSGPASE